MKKFSIIFYGNLNNEIYSIDVKASDWALQRSAETLVVKFFSEDGKMIALFRWDTIVGICDTTEKERESYEQE